MRKGLERFARFGGPPRAGRWRWVFVGLVLLAGAGMVGRGPQRPELVPLRLAEQRLVEADSLERLYSLTLLDPRGAQVDAYLRRPIRRDAAGNSGQAAMPAVILVAGRYTGREAAKVIPGPLESVMLAVEYPQAIPVRISVWEWLRSLPAIRRSAQQMPGVLSGAARYIAEDPDVDGDRIGLVGVSFGVPFAAAAGKDRIFNAVALHYGGTDLSSLFHANLPLENGWVRGSVARFAGWWFRDMDPGRHVGEISPTPLLLINATRDDLIPRAAAERLASLAREPMRQIWLPYGHLRSGEPEIIRELADSTFRYFGYP